MHARTGWADGIDVSYVDLEERVPANHPLRKIREFVNTALAALDAEFVKLYAADGRIPLHDILREIEFLNSLRDRTAFESFRSSSIDVRAASYSIMVISEAVRRIPDEWIAEFPNTPWHAIRAIGSRGDCPRGRSRSPRKMR